MDWTDLPSLSSLRAFAVLAETANYSEAGRRLNVTHGAVLQQVRKLEEHLGVTLVVREGGRPRLTAEGALLARDLAAGFARIRGAVDALGAGDTWRPVQISMSPAFAVSWLMPRLASFQRAHPDITLLLNPTSEVVDLRPGGIDVAVRYTEDPGLAAPGDVILRADMVVVGTPDLLGDTPIDSPADLKRYPWLQELGTEEVAHWMALNGVALERPLMISHMPGNLIMEAVRRGDGITYTARPFVEAEIRGGRLIALFPRPAFGIYYLKMPETVPRPPVKTFLKWLKAQVREGPGALSRPRSRQGRAAS